jgi:hypothetical protein
MLELLREKQGEDQVSQQEDRQDERNDGDNVDVHQSYLNFWQALTYRNARAKKTIVKSNIVKSCIAAS